MVSPRQVARLGLGAAFLVFISCLAVLHSKASEARRALRAQPMHAAPDFVLPDAAGRQVQLSSLRGAPVVLCFRAIDCPVSNAYDSRLSEFARRFADPARNYRPVSLPSDSPLPAPPPVSILSINVGAGIPSGHRTGMKYLLDPGGKVADEYAVEVTPTFFVLDGSGQIRYRGSFDDNRNAAQAGSRYCQEAVECLLHGQPVNHPLTAPFGCNLPKSVQLSAAR